MAGTTPSQGIPYAERPDAFQLTADLRGSFNKIDSVFAQTRGESTAALTVASAAQLAAGQALTRVNAIEDPIHEGPTSDPPQDGEALWLVTNEDAPPTPVSLAWDDVTDKPDVLVAEDLDPITTRLTAVESTVDRVKLANSSMGTGAPTGTAPVGWHYTDIATGDVYRMEA